MTKVVQKYKMKLMKKYTFGIAFSKSKENDIVYRILNKHM